jgi:hypothetical protein
MAGAIRLLEFRGSKVSSRLATGTFSHAFDEDGGPALTFRLAAQSGEQNN